MPHREHILSVTANSDLMLTRNCMAARTLSSGMLSLDAMQPGQRANGAASRMTVATLSQRPDQLASSGPRGLHDCLQYFIGSWHSAARAQREPDCTLTLYNRQPGWSG